MKGKGLTGKWFNGERTKDFELDQRTVFSADSPLLWNKGRHIPTFMYSFWVWIHSSQMGEVSTNG
jgi:hypothetical protein